MCFVVAVVFHFENISRKVKKNAINYVKKKKKKTRERARAKNTQQTYVTKSLLLNTGIHTCNYIYYIEFRAVDIDFSSVFWLHRRNCERDSHSCRLPYILINDLVSLSWPFTLLCSVYLFYFTFYFVSILDLCHSDLPMNEPN